MALCYLVAVRIIDFNEKEPIWAVLMQFALGGAAALALHLTVSSAFLELNVVPGVLATELARFMAIGGGVGVLVAVGQRRGYSEINGLTDGVVYGAAGGLGFATGQAAVRELLIPSATLAGIVSPSAGGFAELGLIGLSDGLFGALIGIGFAAAVEARSQATRLFAPIGGFVAAAMAHVSYDFVAFANTFGEGAVLRKWSALLFPVVAVAAVTVWALGREKRAINDELGGEEETGAVSSADLALLQSFVARERAYFGALFKGNIARWTALHDLHSRQVQLALAKHKAHHEKDADKRAVVGREVAKLRAAVLELKHKMDGTRAAPADPAPPSAA
jgi:hypothetical protein